MISIARERPIGLDPALIYSLLANPYNLPRILPRIARVEAGQPQGGAMPLTLFVHAERGQLRPAQGVFRTFPYREVSFECFQPLPGLARWILDPLQQGGTLLRAIIDVDLKPLLGPLALITPTALIKRQGGVEIDQTLAHVERLAQELRARN